MKYRRRLLTGITSLGLIVSLLVTSQASPASWQAFVDASRNWARTAVNLVSDTQIGPVVSASQLEDELDNWRNWPKSRKHKDFDGGWILPFEAFQQTKSRNTYGPGANNGNAMLIDINGDGLQDYLYSEGNPVIPSRNVELWRGVTQFIALKRSNGWELVYKCYQRGQTTGTEYGNILSSGNEYWYYGDCADTSYTAEEEEYVYAPWSPLDFWVKNIPNTESSKRYDYEDLIYENLGIISTSETQNKVVELNNTLFYEYENTYYDREAPQFIDWNGDGLVDVVFDGHLKYDEKLADLYIGGVRIVNNEAQFLLLNNGRGFDLVFACRRSGTAYYLYCIEN